MKKKTDKELAETCFYFKPSGTYKDDEGNPTCLAHLQEARVFDCGVWLGREHISKKTPVSHCADFKAKESLE